MLIPRHVQMDVNSIIKDLENRLSCERCKALHKTFMQRIDELIEAPQSWPTFLTDVLNSQDDLPIGIQSSVLRNRVWNSPGTAWSQFHSEPGNFAKCLEKATTAIAKNAAKIIDCMRRYISQKRSMNSEESTSTEKSSLLVTPQNDKVKLHESHSTSNLDKNSHTHRNTHKEPPKTSTNATVTDASVTIATASTTVTDASAYATAIGARADIANANAQAGTISASAAATGVSSSVANASAEAGSLNASVTATGASFNVLNASAKAASVNAHAGIHGFTLNAGNVSANLGTATFSADIGPTVSAFNASFSPFTITVDANPFYIAFGNVGFGGISVGWPNLLNMFNLGSGGGGGGGSNGESSAQNGSQAGTNESQTSGDANAGSSGNPIKQLMTAMNICETKLSKHMPNWYLGTKGNFYRNGVLVKHGGIKTAQYKQPMDSSYKHEIHEPVQGSSIATGNDPLGVPANSTEAQAVIGMHFPDAPEYHNTDSCSIWTIAMANQMQDVHSVTGVNRDNLSSTLPVLLGNHANGGSVLLMSVQGGYDHYFAMTGHDDHVMITHAWQDQHVLRNEPPIHVNEFCNHMSILLDPHASVENRTAACHALFNSPENTLLGTQPVKITSVFRGQLGPPLVHHEGATRNVPGLTQVSDLKIQAKRPVLTPNFIRTQKAVNTGNPSSDNTNDEVMELVEAYFLEVGDTNQQEFQDALSFATSAEGLAEQKEEENEQPKELCRYCALKGRPCCLPCLIGGSRKKIISIGSEGNIHGFAD